MRNRDEICRRRDVDVRFAKGRSGSAGDLHGAQSVVLVAYEARFEGCVEGSGIGVGNEPD